MVQPAGVIPNSDIIKSENIRIRNPMEALFLLLDIVNTVLEISSILLGQ